MENLNFKRNRVSSIDILRGIIMLIMALDHTRDYFHVKGISEDPANLATTTPALFFTRWITHFCAPVFIFLSGLSAFISGQGKTKKELSKFLITRGLWLVLFEIVVMNLILTFNPAYNTILLLVIWAIGWSMVILGLLVLTSYQTILIAGLVIFLGHNITDHINFTRGGIIGELWKTLLAARGSVYTLGPDRVVLMGYTILPWTSIMLLGYSLGHFYKREMNEAQRKKSLLAIGAGLIVLFVVLRLINGYGDPSPWTTQKSWLFTVLSFLNTTKYPVSLQYACMTLGPAILFLAYSEKLKSRFTGFATVYGRVPLFYYAGHFLLIHMLCVIVFFATGHSFSEIADPQSPFLFRPVDFGFSLTVTYLFWLMVILLMYYPCKWYGQYKATHQKWWLSYL